MSFDPYLNWLGIPPHEQPPNMYRLLGVVLFESNPEVIEAAADRQSLRVGVYQGEPYGEMCQQLLSEIAMAQFCLLDPQQKAAYDSRLQEELAHRGERVVAPPPPAWSAADHEYMVPGRPAPSSPQFGSPAADYGPAGMGPIDQGQGMQGPVQGPMIMPGPPPPMQAPMPGPAPMALPPGMQPPAAMPMPAGGMPMPPVPSGMQAPPGLQQPPAMRMPPPQPMVPMPSPGTMPGPVGFPGAGSPRAAPAPVPVAAPFPTATSMPAARPAQPAAPPAFPPAAPQRPIDELETLTSQPTGRRRRVLKKPKADHTKEIVIGSIVAVAGLLLFIVYLAMGRTPSGFNGLAESVNREKAKPVDVRAKVVEERKKELAKIKEKEAKEREEKAKKATARAGGGSEGGGALRPFTPGTASPAVDDDPRMPYSRERRADDGPSAMHRKPALLSTWRRSPMVMIPRETWAVRTIR